MSRQPRTFLASLRRDGLAFAILAAVVVLVVHAKPLAEAKAAGSPFAGVICSSFGVVQPGSGQLPGTPPGADDCPFCLAGAHAQPLLSVSPPALPAHARTASPVRWTMGQERGGKPARTLPPAIRGPPVCV
ncbi:MAG: hypothetical protein CMJ42_22400 [Phyllobacteriaceae bacterium]|nr:hypothetical protein [Phyllobacteriaceae bacterium]MBA92667.1 hypothetical protein [Phyllobacteriaceae bacterium]